MLVAALRLPPPPPPLSRAKLRALLLAARASELLRPIAVNDAAADNNCNTVRHLVRIA